MASTPAVGTPEYDALMAETGGAAANPGFDYAAHIAATSGANSPPEPSSPPPAAPPPPDNGSGSPPAAPYVDPTPIPSPGSMSTPPLRPKPLAMWTRRWLRKPRVT